MRRTQITEGFYWIDRLHFGLTIGRVESEGHDHYVMFHGSTASFQIGTPDASNRMRIEPRRFKAKVEDYVYPTRQKKESWE